jgi:hypothetical protein
MKNSKQCAVRFTYLLLIFFFSGQTVWSQETFIVQKDANILVSSDSAVKYEWFKFDENLHEVPLVGGHQRFYYFPDGISNQSDSVFFVVLDGNARSFIWPLHQIETFALENTNPIHLEVDYYDKKILIILPEDPKTESFNPIFTISYMAKLFREGIEQESGLSPVEYDFGVTNVFSYTYDLLDFGNNKTTWTIRIEIQSPLNFLVDEWDMQDCWSTANSRYEFSSFDLLDVYFDIGEEQETFLYCRQAGQTDNACWTELLSYIPIGQNHYIFDSQSRSMLRKGFEYEYVLERTSLGVVIDRKSSQKFVINDDRISSSFHNNQFLKVSIDPNNSTAYIVPSKSLFSSNITLVVSDINGRYVKCNGLIPGDAFKLDFKNMPFTGNILLISCYDNNGHFTSCKITSIQ